MAQNRDNPDEMPVFSAFRLTKYHRIRRFVTRVVPFGGRFRRTRQPKRVGCCRTDKSWMANRSWTCPRSMGDSWPFDSRRLRQHNIWLVGSRNQSQSCLWQVESSFDAIDGGRGASLVSLRNRTTKCWPGISPGQDCYRRMDP